MAGNRNIFLSLIKLLGIPHTKGFTQYSYEEHPYKYSFLWSEEFGRIIRY